MRATSASTPLSRWARQPSLARAAMRRRVRGRRQERSVRCARGVSEVRERGRAGVRTYHQLRRDFPFEAVLPDKLQHALARVAHTLIAVSAFVVPRLVQQAARLLRFLKVFTRSRGRTDVRSWCIDKRPLRSDHYATSPHANAPQIGAGWGRPETDRRSYHWRWRPRTCSLGQAPLQP